jgi:hypothetical protein
MHRQITRASLVMQEKAATLRLSYGVISNRLDRILNLPLYRTYNLTTLILPSASSRTSEPITLAEERKTTNEIKWSRQRCFSNGS